MDCRHESLAAKEELAGTAVHAESIALLEYNGTWLPKPLECGLPESTKSLFTRHTSCRLQLLHRPRRKTSDITLFVWRAKQLYRFSLKAYSELTEHHILAPQSLTDAILWKEATFFVCTHGKRDMCCAKEGVALYKKLEAIAPGQAWETTHIGGHRFAPTLLALPSGNCFGRIEHQNLPQLVSSEKCGSLDDLTCFRGNASLEPSAQYAEYWFRKETATKNGEIVIRKISGIDNHFRFQISVGDIQWDVEVNSVPTDKEIRKSCGTQDLSQVHYFEAKRL